MSKRTSLGDHQQATTAADVPERKHPETFPEKLASDAGPRFFVFLFFQKK
jgi:hypothetical protein